MAYIELPADHEFTAFLAALTPGKVLKDRSALFSRPEKKREVFLRAKSKHELAQERHEQIQVAMRMAREMRESSNGIHNG